MRPIGSSFRNSARILGSPPVSASAIPKHLSQLVLHAAPNASQVDRHHAIPLVTADLSRVDAALHDASVVERGVEPPEREHGPVNHGRPWVSSVTSQRTARVLPPLALRP